MAFLMPYGFGCELWAPLLKELGRESLMQASMALVIVTPKQKRCCSAITANLYSCNSHLKFTVVMPASHNFATVLALRILTGFGTGGSLILGVAADMYGSHQQQPAVAAFLQASALFSV